MARSHALPSAGRSKVPSTRPVEPIFTMLGTTHCPAHPDASDELAIHTFPAASIARAVGMEGIG